MNKNDSEYKPLLIFPLLYVTNNVNNNVINNV